MHHAALQQLLHLEPAAAYHEVHCMFERPVYDAVMDVEVVTVIAAAWLSRFAGMT